MTKGSRVVPEERNCHANPGDERWISRWDLGRARPLSEPVDLVKASESDGEAEDELQEQDREENIHDRLLCDQNSTKARDPRSHRDRTFSD